MIVSKKSAADKLVFLDPGKLKANQLLEELGD